VQNYCLPADDMRSIVAAFRTSFPHVYLFETFEGTDLLLLGSREPVYLDLERIDRKMSELRVWMDLNRTGITKPAEILPLFRLGPGEVDRLVAGAPSNSDDNARVEFSAPKSLYLETLPANLQLIDGFAVSPREYLRPAPEPGLETDRLRLDLAKAWLKRGYPEKAVRQASKALDGPLSAEAEEFIAQINMR
jgi:hypothetical protein